MSIPVSVRKRRLPSLRFIKSYQKQRSYTLGYLCRYLSTWDEDPDIYYFSDIKYDCLHGCNRITYYFCTTINLGAFGSSYKPFKSIKIFKRKDDITTRRLIFQQEQQEWEEN